MTGQTLIAGVGNIFLGDDGFGVEVAGRLAAAQLPAGVKVADYGIRGMHLAFDLSGYQLAILIDTTPRGGAPGTLYLIEPEFGADTADADTATTGIASAADETAAGTDENDTDSGGTGSGEAGAGAADKGDADDALAASPLLDAHGMQPDMVFSMLDTLGGNRPGRILIVGCEPASIEQGMGLSAPVAAAVDEAVRVVLDLVTAGEGDVMAEGAQGADGQHLLAEGWAHVPRHSG